MTVTVSERREINIVIVTFEGIMIKSATRVMQIFQVKKMG